tara:strand:- start:1253 stop:1993 length:741 start_codon:yes stop_codon:yes gene_type:complete
MDYDFDEPNQVQNVMYESTQVQNMMYESTQVQKEIAKVQYEHESTQVEDVVPDTEPTQVENVVPDIEPTQVENVIVLEEIYEPVQNEYDDIFQPFAPKRIPHPLINFTVFSVLSNTLHSRVSFNNNNNNNVPIHEIITNSIGSRTATLVHASTECWDALAGPTDLGRYYIGTLSTRSRFPKIQSSPFTMVRCPVGLNYSQNSDFITSFINTFFLNFEYPLILFLSSNTLIFIETHILDYSSTALFL